jgi:hypothetical protein
LDWLHSPANFRRNPPQPAIQKVKLLLQPPQGYSLPEPSSALP